MANNCNNLKTPKKDLKSIIGNPMITPTIGKLLLDGPNSADSDDFEGLPLFDDIKDDLDKENMDSNHRSNFKSESVFHKRKDSGGSLFMKSYEENQKNSKTPTSSTKATSFYSRSKQTPTSSVKAPTFYSRGKQMLQAASQNFLEVQTAAKRPQLLSSPVKKPRLGEGIFNRWQEKPRLYTSSSNQPKLKGFSNLGNTCYMNAILQSLFSLEPFVDDVLNFDVFRDMPRESLYKAVCQLLHAKRKDRANSEIQNFLLSLKGAISNTATRFSGYLQHDAHEFLGQCLDQLKEDVLKLNKKCASLKDMENTKRLARDAAAADQSPPPKYPCAISRNFEFTVLHTIQCNKCKEIITKSETCHDLSLDIPRRRSSLSRVSIQTALDQFFQTESVEYTCEECGCKESTVRHSFTKLPRVIILQLKRYSFDMNSAHKLCQSILIPSYMTLARHCTRQSKPAYPLHSQPSRVAVKPEMMSPGPADGSERLPRKRLSYERGSEDRNGFSFKRKRLTDYDSDLDELAMIDLTNDSNPKSSNSKDKVTEINSEPKPVDQMSEEEQLAYVLEMSREENTCKKTEDDQLAMALEMSMHETTFTPISGHPTTPKAVPTEPIRKHLHFDGGSPERNSDSGVGVTNHEEEFEKKNDRKSASLPNGVPSNDSGISMEGVEPLDRVASPVLTYLDYADVVMKGNETQQCSNREERISVSEKTAHSYTNDTPQNEEDEALALERAMQLSLQEFETTITNGSARKQSINKETECVQTIEYTKEEEEELEINYECGQMPNSYKLLSIVSHIGSTSAIGHYVSDVYDHKKSTWFSYDDSEVLRTTAKRVQEVRQKNGYIFFYMSTDLCT